MAHLSRKEGESSWQTLRFRKRSTTRGITPILKDLQDPTHVQVTAGPGEILVLANLENCLENTEKGVGVSVCHFMSVDHRHNVFDFPKTVMVLG